MAFAVRLQEQIKLPGVPASQQRALPVSERSQPAAGRAAGAFFLVCFVYDPWPEIPADRVAARHDPRGAVRPQAGRDTERSVRPACAKRGDGGKRTSNGQQRSHELHMGSSVPTNVLRWVAARGHCGPCASVIPSRIASQLASSLFCASAGTVRARASFGSLTTRFQMLARPK